MARLELEQLRKRFPLSGKQSVNAVEGVSLDVADGEWVVLAGPSGCGKTTILRLIAGLESPDGGTVRLDGQVINSRPAGQRDIAMVFQTLALYPHMSVHDNIAFGLRVRGLDERQVRVRVQEVLEAVGLVSMHTRKPNELSGGERQRVAIARALARRPALLLLDEPLSNIDPSLRAQVRADFLRLRAQFKTTALYVTHDQVDAMMVGDRIAVLKFGAVQQVGTSEIIYERPATEFVARFFGFPPMNLVEGRLIERGPEVWFAAPHSGRDSAPELFQVRIATVPLSRSRAFQANAVTLGIRPEHIHVSGTDAGSDATTHSGIVRAVRFIGSERHITLETAAGELVARAPMRPMFAAGAQVLFDIDMGSARLFDTETGAAIYSW